MNKFQVIYTEKIHEYNTQKTNVTGYYEMKLDNPFTAKF